MFFAEITPFFKDFKNGRSLKVLESLRYSLKNTDGIFCMDLKTFGDFAQIVLEFRHCKKANGLVSEAVFRLLLCINE